MEDLKKIRCYSWSLICYELFEHIKDSIDSNVNLISHYAISPLHDEDIFEDDVYDNGVLVHNKGDLKKPHYHILITFKEKYSLKRIHSLFGFSVLGQKLGNRFLAYEYLTHLNDTDKVLYDDLFIVCNDKSYYIRSPNSDSDIEKNSICLQMLDDIISKVSYREMVLNYGRDYVLNYSRYLKMARLICLQENKDINDLINDYNYIEDN